MEKIEIKVRQAVLRCGMIADGDRVLVGLSGGQDSMSLLHLLALRSKEYRPRFTVEAAYVKMRNIAYRNDEARLRLFADSLGVPLHVVETEFDPTTDRRHTPCYLCSHYRRRELFNLAERLGCQKLALGHHLDDVVATALLNMIQQGSFSSFPPVLQMEHYPLSIIRPLFFVRKQMVARWAEAHNYQLSVTPCPYDTATQREEAKALAAQMERMNPDFVYSVLHALGYKL